MSTDAKRRPRLSLPVSTLKKSVEMNCAFDRIAGASPRQWLYLLGDEGVVYSETQNRIAGLDAAGVSAYRAFDAGASVEDLRKVSGEHAAVATSDDGLEIIHALSRGIFPAEEPAIAWPRLDSPSTANIEIHGIPICLEYPQGPLEELCRDYFRNCTASAQPARCHLSAQHTEKGWAICVNGCEFYSVQHEEQLGLSLLHAARSMLYAEGEYDVAFHAAMVSDGERGIMLCAPRESGKSTLAAYLTAQGLELLTDEPALLDLGTGFVAPLRLPISLKQGSWPILQREYPQLARSRVHVRSDGTKICFLHPPLERYSPQPRRLTHLVFPRYRASAEARAERLPAFRTLALLSEGGMLMARDLRRPGFEALLQFVCLTPAYEIQYESLQEAFRFILELCLQAI